MRIQIVAACFGLMALAVSASAGEWKGSVSAETRLFTGSPLYPEQHGHNLSISGTAEFNHEWPERNESFHFSPFLRLDQHDNQRTHADIRELYWQKVARQWELRLGFRRVFWGVTESQNLVDIINQRDTVEGLAANAKLGQLMLNFAWVQDWGTLDFFVMPLFRERTFPGRRGRFRAPVPIDTDRTVYESGAEEWHTDLAMRYSHHFGNWDVGLSHFSGTSRDPRFLARVYGFTLSPDSPFANLSGPVIDSVFVRLLQRIPNARLIPYYDQIEQTGIDLQYTRGSWCWKLEAIRRSGQERTYTAATAGVEYTIGAIFRSPLDVGLILEYMWDSRGKAALTPFDNDFFVGGRVTFNDVQSTNVLGGLIIDADTGAMAAGLEGSRRIGENWRISLEGRLFANIPADDILTTVRKDDFFQAELTWFF